MNPVILWITAAAVTVFHFWASRRKPKYWYLGGIVPALWVGTLMLLFVNDMIHIGEDWRILLFPTLLLILIWISGHESAKKTEMDRMKAQDM